MSKLDNIIANNSNQSYRAGNGNSHKSQSEIGIVTKQQIKDLILEIIGETDFAYKDASAYAEVLKKKVSNL